MCIRDRFNTIGNANFVNDVSSFYIISVHEKFFTF